jgi:predicted RNA-binding protein with TRAM domain
MGYGNDDRGDFGPKPVKAGDVLDLTIEAIAAKGDGIAKKDGFVIFIKGGQMGQTYKVKISELKARSAVGEIVTGDAPAPTA